MSALQTTEDQSDSTWYFFHELAKNAHENAVKSMVLGHTEESNRWKALCAWYMKRRDLEKKPDKEL